MTKTEMVEIPKVEYEKLKELEALEELDLELFKKIVKSLRAYKEGRFRKWT